MPAGPGHTAPVTRGESTCKSTTGCPCVCAPQHYHYARLARAARDGLITTEDFAQVIHDADVFTGLDTVTDPGTVTA